MKKIAVFVLAFLLLFSQAFARQIDSAEEAADCLLDGNAAYVSGAEVRGDISAQRRSDTAENGQHPYAVIVTCSDSRVPAEHIFGAGVGDLFVIRTAGNVIGDYEKGSVEYGAEHLHAKLVVVLGHTHCGAVDAALNGGAHGNIAAITDEIAAHLPGNCDPRDAEILNVENSIAQIRSSEILQELEAKGEVEIRGAIYDIVSGEVRFLN